MSIGVDQLDITEHDRGGIGGAVFNNSVKLAKVTLNGGDGGNGGVGGNFSDATDSGGLGGIGASTSNNDGAGNGGFGGGSVFGGVSIGGTGTITASGDGGGVHDNSVDLRDVILNGGKGGNGASTSNCDGAGNGDGDSDYKGGGVFARIDFAGTGLGRVKDLTTDDTDGLYADASLRVGQSNSKFDVGRNLDVLGHSSDYRGSYDSDVTYYGGHVGGGYVFNFNEKNALDVYGRYLWTHVDSDTVKVGSERLQIDSSTNSRIELGSRYHYGYNNWVKPYVGASYDYEFDGEVAAEAYEFHLDKPSLEGSTGIFEAGVKLNPIKTKQALSVNVDGQGYVGKRQGGGGVKLKYEF